MSGPEYFYKKSIAMRHIKTLTATTNYCYLNYFFSFADAKMWVIHLKKNFFLNRKINIPCTIITRVCIKHRFKTVVSVWGLAQFLYLI